MHKKWTFKWISAFPALLAVLVSAAWSSDVAKHEHDEAANVPGRVFQDCEVCPEMIVVPEGNFRMGSTQAEQDWSAEHGRPREYTDRESPMHDVEIIQPFAVGRYEVTRREFAAFVEETSYEPGNQCLTFELTDSEFEFKERSNRDWLNPALDQTDDHPVVCMSWEDSIAYTEWLSKRTGEAYRLLSEAEWEYVARSGTQTYRYWGGPETDPEACRYANNADTTPLPHGDRWPEYFECSDGYWGTSPVGEFEANAFGVYDILGNVWEWVADCGHDTYESAPADGRAWIQGGDCSIRAIRGGAYHEPSAFTRSAVRGLAPGDVRYSNSGFRIARDLH